MSDYVLILSLGPVQGFIAAARRSRDLWCGSWLLSEISKAAAHALDQAGARLIFPAPGAAADLRPGSDFSVGNKVQVVVSGDEAQVRALADTAAKAARARFVALAAEARERLGVGGLREDVWQAQVHDYVESFAAWAPITEAGYGDAVNHAAQALAARKATRDFGPSARCATEAPFYGLPKSSLDGARETVLPEDAGKGGAKRGLPVRARMKLGISGNEQLDCAGVIKRLAGKVEQFTPLSRIAAHRWIADLPAADRERLAAAYEPLVRESLATRVKGNPRFADFEYDAQYLYRARLEAALGEARDDLELTGWLEALQKLLKPLWRTYGEPCPYFVILLADGDKMGALLNEVSKEKDHLEITRALSDFAGRVPARVQEFEGHAVYAGGDDVFAFLPLDQAYACADALQQDFAARLQEVATQLGATSRPTLSVGLGIGHMLEPLGELRALASRAEKHAKGDSLPAEQRRDALAIILRTRGNSETLVRMRWSDAAALEDFAAWHRAYAPAARSLPSRLAYDTRAVHLRTAFATRAPTAEPGIPLAEFKLLLKRARTEDGKEISQALAHQLQNTVERRTGSDSLALLASELIVARWLAARTARDLGERDD